MGGQFCVVSVRPGPEGRLERVDHFFTDSRAVFDYADMLSERDDLPEDVSFTWMELTRIDQSARPGDCHPPAEVLRSLDWLEEVARRDLPENRQFLKESVADLWPPSERERLEAGRVKEWLQWDLNKIRALAERAKGENWQIVVGWVL